MMKAREMNPEIDRILKRCWLPEEDVVGHEIKEGIPGAVVEGILNKYAFHKLRLQEEKEKIADLLRMLPKEFFVVSQGGGGGWTFINACLTCDQEQWTGLHLYQERLFVLGMGLGWVPYTVKRELWPLLPGSVPYLTIKIADY